jgi:recombination protein RecT
MTEENASTESKEVALTKITKYLDSEIVQSRFVQVLGSRNSGPYIASVMTVVKDSKSLQGCSVSSIYTSALRAATLRLSVDPATGQAYLVPFKGQATLIVGYKGLYDMAVRTGKYRYINVGPIYEGQTVEENQITGFHTITGSIKGTRQDNEIIGWIGAFEMNPEKGMLNGFGKTMYMTCEEIHAHAQQYSKGYGTINKDGIPVDQYGKPTIWYTEKRKMERKTVLRLLIRRWGYLNPNDVQELEVIEGESAPIDAQIYEVPEYTEDMTEDVSTPRKSQEQLLNELGV